MTDLRHANRKERHLLTLKKRYSSLQSNFFFLHICPPQAIQSHYIKADAYGVRSVSIIANAPTEIHKYIRFTNKLDSQMHAEQMQSNTHIHKLRLVCLWIATHLFVGF